MRICVYTYILLYQSEYYYSGIGGEGLGDD